MKDRFALHFVPEDYPVGGQKLMGRHAAGAALMRAIAHSGELATVGCFAARYNCLDYDFSRSGKTSVKIIVDKR